MWLTDVAGLTREAAAELMRWSAQALRRASLADVPAAASAGATDTTDRRERRATLG